MTAFIAAIASCKKTEEEETRISVDPTAVSFVAKEPGSQAVALVSSSEWTAKYPEWITISPRKGSGDAVVTITPTENDLTEQRKGDIVFSSGGKTATVSVTQDAAGPKPEVQTLSVTVKLPQSAEISWIKDEEILVFTSKNRFVTFSCKSGEGSSTGVFEAEVNKDETLKGPVLYPVNAYEIQDDKAKLLIPDSFTSMDAASNFIPMAATTVQDGNADLCIITGRATYKLHNIPAITTAVNFTSSYVLSGKFEIDFSEDVPFVKTEKGEGKLAIEHKDMPEGITAEFNIPVLTGLDDLSAELVGGTTLIETSSRSAKFSDAVTAGASVNLPEGWIYKTKKYGQKTWFVEACKEGGQNGDIGVLYDFTSMTSDMLPSTKGNQTGGHQQLIPADEKDMVIWTSTKGKNVLKWLTEEGVRYYSYAEMMQGDSRTDGKKPSWSNTPNSGVDAMGRTYDFGTDAGSDETYLSSGCNAQIQGCCPDGWHVSNLNDWWDLLHAIKEEYSIADDPTGKDWIEYGTYALTGYIDGQNTLHSHDGFSFVSGKNPISSTTQPVTKKELLQRGTNWYNCGNVAVWLKGAKTSVIYDEGYWTFHGQNWANPEVGSVYNTGGTGNGYGWINPNDWRDGTQAVTDAGQPSYRQNNYVYKGGSVDFNFYQPCWMNTDGKLWKDEFGFTAYCRIPGLQDKADGTGRDRTRGFRISMNGGWRQPNLEALRPGDGSTTRNDALRMSVRCVKNYDFTDSNYQ